MKSKPKETIKKPIKGKKSSEPEKETEKKTRPPIKQIDNIYLWVASGGRCAFCNKYLLGEEHFCIDLNLSEKAHIVGWDNAPGSPRGDNALPLDKRNLAENLMLLCFDHHKAIDDNKHLPDFSVERLRAQKIKHESRIKYLTGLKEDQETVILRMLGPIRGSKVEVSKQHATAVVLKNADKYPRFPLVLDGQDVEINTANFPDPETAWEAHWEIGKSIINQQTSKIHEGLANGTIRHLSIFGLARIPLLIYLGYRLDDKVPTDIYQKQRGENESWFWNSEAEPVEFHFSKIASSSSLEKVAIILSISGTISTANVKETLKEEYNIFEISPMGVTPNRDIFQSKTSLDNFSRAFHDLLSELETTNKQAKEVHLFSAIPVSAAIACGRGLMLDAHPKVLVYDFTNGNYKFALTIN